ncbi:hypothetical protein [Duganella radicis]|uniref:Protein CopB n=1 Tax=Duganella radicis TaxID=551988 RepID=A0A6L6PCM1_9BURK|nr:hypothetical protein [Duganella radicis]MTV36267.1 hypothetical protein [Duganella radicis]
MRDAKDHITAEIPGVRPLPKPRPKLYASKAEKQAAYRARNNVVVRTIHLPADVDAGLQAVLEKKGEGISAVLAKLIQSQLLRKR